MKRNFLKILLCTLLLLLAVVLGKVAGSACAGVPALSWLNLGTSFGFAPTTIDLSVLQFTLGFTMQINVAQGILLIAAILASCKIKIKG